MRECIFTLRCTEGAKDLCCSQGEGHGQSKERDPSNDTAENGTDCWRMDRDTDAAWLVLAPELEHVPRPVLWFPLVAQMVKNPPAMRETWVQSLGQGRSPGEGNGYPLQCSCLENFMRQRSLAGHSPWGCKESDTTERLTLSLLFKCSNAQTWSQTPRNSLPSMCVEIYEHFNFC